MRSGQQPSAIEVAADETAYSEPLRADASSTVVAVIVTLTDQDATDVTVTLQGALSETAADDVWVDTAITGALVIQEPPQHILAGSEDVIWQVWPWYRLKVDAVDDPATVEFVLIGL